MNPHQSADLPQGDILVVDDTQANLSLLVDLLGAAGYHVRPAGSGELALRSVKARLPDLILLDINMPGMDGLEVCRQLKADEKTQAIPVIFITVYEDEQSMLKGFEAGAVDFITKPFAEKVVLARVRTHLALRHIQMRYESQNAQLAAEIIERKQAEALLVESRTQLEARVALRTQELQKANEGLLGEIAERKQAEAEKDKLEIQNRQLQKSESLGRMAGAIAHHFNNQLQVVSGNLEMALENLPPVAGKQATFLSNAMQATSRAAEVSSLMLTYLGQASSLRHPLDLSEACRTTLPVLQAAMPRNVVLESVLASPGPIVLGDANQIQQVLSNLVTNAWEATNNGPGVLQVSVTTTVPPAHSPMPRFPIKSPLQNKAYACLEVKDTGCGIAAKDMDTLFDPFYSSKFPGRGMGLPVVLGIVRAHEGVITVDSESGRGSIFRVYFPLATEEIPLPAQRAAEVTRDQSGRTVLVVEDEEMLRELTEMLLIGLGYSVLTAKDGIEAVEVFRQHVHEIDCVLCDMNMPRMNGWETLTALRQVTPGLPVILSSGYSEVQVMANEHREEPQAFLKKPYQRVQLREALQKALAGKSDT